MPSKSEHHDDDQARRDWRVAQRLGPLTSLLFKIKLIYGHQTYKKRWPINRISRTRVVKTTRHTIPTEALTLDYIAANTSIPVPRVHHLYKDGYGYQYLVMDYVDGIELEVAWKTLGPQERLAVVHQLRDYIGQLRALKPPHPGAVEAVNGGLCHDFRVRGGEGFRFDTVSEFQLLLGRSWILENKRDKYERHASALQRCASRTCRTVFTHCDLAPRNILVSGSRIVGIVDWEMSGWYPEYWEYTQAYFSNLRDTEDFWELFEKEGVPERYPDELIFEVCLAAEFVRC
ncbi:kinase-like domain-containing protein [Roridomyces roridus]|uniref:Kinase-like domain-containing protein n=1 Tax=Roridomyces roridus TaxID=1738132 RepID=A0AAD7CMQ0_9AGAR|nr:kinase-like domain-containing protein [Roridomyces roridus]